MPVENGELVGSIDDQQGLFNVNNLLTDGKVNSMQLARFQRLLSLVGLPSALAEALVDWIDEDDKPQPKNGAEDDFYLALDPPYRPANRPMIDIEELALVRGFDSRVRAQLAPFVTALPGTTGVNVNTAPAEVLAIMVDGLDLDPARVLVARRNTSYYRANADFIAQLPKDATVPAQDIRVGSDYFLATMRVHSGGAQVSGKALLERQDPARWPTVIWRKIQ
jgi:general secretion pathway protein K